MALIDYCNREQIEEHPDVLEKRRYGNGNSKFLRILMHNPGVLGAKYDYHESIIESGRLDEDLYELIHAVVSRTNECSYCEHNHHKRAVADNDLTDDEADALRNGEYDFLAEGKQAALRIAEQAAADPSGITADQIDRFIAAGYDERDVIQLLALVGNAETSNLFASGLDLYPEE